MTAPLAVDIDGTLTGPERALDPRALAALGEWAGPVVIATGKALPYPVALCEFAGRPVAVVAENGGVVCIGEDAAADGEGELVVEGDREAAQAVADDYTDAGAGRDLGWGALDIVNRWRETEVAVSRASPVEPLRELAAERGLDVVDTGFAYHVKSPAVDKGRALRTAADRLGLEGEDFVAIGDSENDAAAFQAAGRSFAVANADATAKRAADSVTEAAYSEGFLEALAGVEGER
jgi:phosphoglycolate phosphatase (TIGR01487 family)